MWLTEYLVSFESKSFKESIATIHKPVIQVYREISACFLAGNSINSRWRRPYRDVGPRENSLDLSADILILTRILGLQCGHSTEKDLRFRLMHNIWWVIFLSILFYKTSQPIIFSLKCPVPIKNYDSCYLIVCFYVCCIVVCFCCTSVFCCFVVILL